MWYQVLFINTIDIHNVYIEDNLLFSLNLFYLHYSSKLDWTQVITTLVKSTITSSLKLTSHMMFFFVCLGNLSSSSLLFISFEHFISPYFIYIFVYNNVKFICIIIAIMCNHYVLYFCKKVIVDFTNVVITCVQSNLLL
jgi:hypothetical protein